MKRLTTEVPRLTTQMPFVAVRNSGIVMRGAELICKACSHTMACRIANALNLYQPNLRGK